ncbi:Peptidyl-tRNA hydrolase domain containing hypothetical protein [Phytophthora palmivora]|uniref:Prokaryotic-type class I peptide chain release factors domain-containing protein n=1 Tax=Phytophthora palmivora TaxID=4796 RepID=A0A2P4X1N4_9STRA|nr:Peptidyl-tRNA hydrolase domain containing hypothetical protein [Phytophthora palmivora]
MLRLVRGVSTACRWSSVTPASTFHPQSVLPCGHFCLLSSSAPSIPPNEPKKRTEVQLKESELDESFVKGSGKGGQKINKVRNCVLLTHLPTGLQVRCQKTRSLDGNRRAARKLLLQKLDDHVNGLLSKRSEKIEKLRRKKASRRAKSKQKYAKTEKQDLEEEQDEEDSEDDDDGEEFIDLEEHRFKAKKKAK